ncbi:YtxH domain-containing protein [Tellurirhabdus rosea]|uniref:YtxH domain-containing protein n=1 Tax=Tellurirhabdus rosea TaxID=2674997 RepID=UPI00224E3E7E|nr:YtxH domain-containing protein [Tellurirhabdus rosea]
MRSTRDFLLGFLTGVAAGMLTAPRSGRDTRDYLKNEADRRSKDLQGQWQKGVEQVKAQVDQVKSQINQQVDKIQNKAEDQKNKSQYNDKVDNLAEKAHEGVESSRQSLQAE